MVDPKGPAEREVENRQLEQQARALLAQMTLHERLAMMDGDLPLWRGLDDLLRRDCYHKRPFPAGRNERLGIEGVQFIDGPRGIVLEGGATTFPVSMARGATFDPELEERVGDAIGKELRAHGGNLYGGVCVNLLRHPAWGRAQETYGEDPRHIGAMGAALVRGVQRHGMACVKHFAANSMENARFDVDVSMSPRALHEMYLPHFKDCVDAGAAAVMSAYNAVNGQWCGQHRGLLTEVLRDRWGFDGFVVTDFLFGLRDAELGVLAGQDLEMPFRLVYRGKLKSLLDSGRVPAEAVDTAVLRILRKLLSVPKGDYPRSLCACTEHTQLAREVATKSIVLLKNDEEALPLRGQESLALIGKLAAIPNLGDRGSSDSRPAYCVTPLEGLRAALGQRLRYDDGADPSQAAAVAREADVALVVVGYTHAEEGEFIVPTSPKGFVGQLPLPRWLDRMLGTGPLRDWWTRGAELATDGVLALVRKLMAADNTSFGVGGDRGSLRLLPAQVELIRTVAAANPRCVVAIMAGSAVIVQEWIGEVQAAMLLWYPGMEGGHALADVVTGAANPSGRLPFVVPTDESHLPPFDKDAHQVSYDLWHGYRRLDRDAHKPAFPFGFGLSYTPFSLRDLELDAATVELGELKASVEVQNEGRVRGTETVQLYIGAPRASKVPRALKELKAFAKLTLEPGERRRVELTVPLQRLAYFDEDADDFVIEPGQYLVTVGRHAADEQALSAELVVGA